MMLKPLLPMLMTVVFVLGVACPLWATDLVLNWDESADATLYRVYHSADQGTSWTQVAEQAALPITVTAPDDGVLHCYRVSNVNDSGETSRWKQVVCHNNAWGPPAEPTNVGVE